MWKEQRCEGELRGHADSVTCVRAWTDEMLLSASYDATVRQGRRAIEGRAHVRARAHRGRGPGARSAMEPSPGHEARGSDDPRSAMHGSIDGRTPNKPHRVPRTSLRHPAIRPPLSVSGMSHGVW